MPRVKRREKRRTEGYTQGHRIQLENGFDFTPVESGGFGKWHVPPSRQTFDDDACRQGWHDLGDDILAEWIIELPRTRPWAWWRYDAPEPRPEGETEAAYLERLGLLTEYETECSDET